jgi:hypothetical protein
MREAIEQFRQIGSMEVIVSPVDYIFMQTSRTFDDLLARLGRSR